LIGLLRRSFGNASPLFVARLASAALVFALPLVLVRVLSPTVFGLYKQFFLVGGTVLLAGQLGLTQSLFYFLPRGGEQRGAYFTQALISLSALGAFAGVMLFAVLSCWHGTGELAAIRLPLALYAGLMLAASPLEGALISDGKVGTAAIATVALDVLRASLLCVGALWSPRVGPFWAAALSAALRLAAVLALIARGRLPTARPTRACFRAQIGYALPFAGAAALHVLLRSFRSTRSPPASTPPPSRCSRWPRSTSPPSTSCTSRSPTCWWRNFRRRCPPTVAPRQ
jgi:O-antigen/teichoic acid export membrane protein